MPNITNMTWINKALITNLALLTATMVLLLQIVPVNAAVPGITGTNFDLIAEPGFIHQPDGASVYSWGYGCDSSLTPNFAPASISGNCPSMQLPGPTLIVHQNDTVTVTLHNNLPAAAGNTSILFPGFQVTATGGVAGLLTQEAKHADTVTYTFTATTPGTHSYYSGTQGDLQVEMGLYGALIVLPTTANTSVCSDTKNDQARASNSQPDFRLAKAAYDHASACYDREYIFQFSEMDPNIHRQAEEQAALPCTQAAGCMLVATEPYVPAYFMVNGRSMPDLMEPNYAMHLPHQPYNGSPHMHPGELTLLRVIGADRWQHPFHEHGNHVRVLARDGNMLLTATNKLAGPLLFTTTTTPGMTLDGIFQWTGKGLNWDAYGHGLKDGVAVDSSVCTPDANGYYTGNPAASNYYEWCGDHNKALESKPFGQVGSGGPVTLPDANILANGAWYGGSPYLGPDANARSVGSTPIPPSGTVGNDTGSFAYMWHSHNEREITTNNAFPGGMMMMMLVDPWVTSINEAN
ncbi:multicopper oxidase domain-containing protein [Methylotenera versatilis]|uniref:Multicopper oxidase type 3 n=1 Tax=Methylotenera versatilis (strain 301) TaxID=666681 RepID=D7DME5_METV0|nr:multicopper oxidase family protein [Methylotenera versatilis]ADI28856.1 multicopper oxidase type 3 [Methylotenera versatilis 301]